MANKKAPAFTTKPSITPTAGVVGETYRANDGTATNATKYSRRWLLSGKVIGSGTTVVPTNSGSLVLEVTATGRFGFAIARSLAATVAAAIQARVFTTQPSITPMTGMVGNTYRASGGMATNASTYSHRWLKTPEKENVRLRKAASQGGVEPDAGRTHPERRSRGSSKPLAAPCWR